MANVRNLSLLISLATLVACATPPPPPAKSSRARKREAVIEQPAASEDLTPQSAPAPVPTGRVGPKESADFGEVQRVYSTGDYEATINKLGEFEKTYPKSSQGAQVQNLYGLSFLLSKKPDAAVLYFKNSLMRTPPKSSFADYVLYNLASAQFEASQIDDAQASLAKIRVEALDRSSRIKMHYLKARVYQKRGLPVEGSRELLLASRLIGAEASGDARTALTTLCEQTTLAIQNPESLQGLYADFEDSPFADLLLFRLATLEHSVGSTAQTEAYVKLLTSRFPQSAYYSPALQLLKGTATAQADTGPIENQRIGVLLPLQGKFAKFGQPALEAIELGLGIFGASAPLRDEATATLAVRDAGETTESALAALDRLVKQDHVIAVIGPLMSKGAEQISTHAQELGVPLVSLARAEGAPQDWVFQSGLTLRMQAEQIARYAIQTLGMKRFAILQQRDKLGDEAVRHFWDAVEKLGGQIVGIESYGASETDFRQQIDKLSGLYYTDARERELGELAQQRNANGVKKRNRKTELFYTLRPIVDYDAVFIPDDPDHAKLILPTFAYRDVDHVKFLGTSNWNTPDFPAAIGNAGEQTLFVDAFFAHSTSAPNRQFIEKLAITYSRQPEAIEAIAYDAARVVDLAWRNGNAPSSRAEMRDRLRATKDIPGVTGKISYADGELGRDLRVLTVQKGEIVERHAGNRED